MRFDNGSDRNVRSRIGHFDTALGQATNHQVSQCFLDAGFCESAVKDLRGPVDLPRVLRRSCAIDCTAYYGERQDRNTNSRADRVATFGNADKAH